MIHPDEAWRRIEEHLSPLPAESIPRRSAAGRVLARPLTATVDVPGYFSDNAVTLLPGREVKLSFTPRKGAKVTKDAT